ncbi:MAG: hypothetical protein K2X00_22995 [Nitrospiraceae bacterium]|jgi:hypothetical protein|nr:hypothetical protein [Nitrospiraceae bacterium]
MYALSAEQQHTLVCIVNEQRGPQLSFEQFADTILDLFENVPGFETISARRAKRHINELWRMYREQTHEDQQHPLD